MIRRDAVLLSLALLVSGASTHAQTSQLGQFQKSGDIGAVTKAGSVEYDASRASYTVAGGGENMWSDTDALHFVWKQMSGDVSLAADIHWLGTGGQPHRKACLLVRQSLDSDSPYADAVVHGDGLTSLQYREVAGGRTREIQSNVSAPRRLRIEKRGNYVSMSVASDGEALGPAGGTLRLELSEPFYIGLGVCAHDANGVEQAVFSNVEITATKDRATDRTILESTLETVPISSGDRRVVYHTRDHIEAPNWSRDGSYLLFNSRGRIYKLPVAGGEPMHVNTGRAARNNNDHGLSPDGTLLAISDQTDGASRIHVLPAEGGPPRLVTPDAPSYWHGWSPDGKTLAYCAQRNGDYDVYTIPVDGGPETRLTSSKGLDDGPDYSHDGKHIYFNSERTGSMQIWRMNADGSDEQQITFDEYNDWFPHPSPDGRWLVFLSYAADVQGHPANQDVMLRLMATSGGEIQVLAKLFGGQGTINVPSWSPDSSRVAFVSYRLTTP